MLNGLGSISHISFGSECSSIDKLREIAVCLADEPEEYKKSLRKYISSGLNMPAARSHAFSELYGYDAKEILAAPNNILAIEYMKAFYDRFNIKLYCYTQIYGVRGNRAYTQCLK